MKQFARTTSVFFAFLLFAVAVSGQVQDYASLVNTQIGNKGKGARKEEAYLEAGYTFPGATYPFGMVQFTPTFFNPSKGFVVNQMSGAGCEHMGNFPTLPIAGRLKASPADMTNLATELNITRSSAGLFEVQVGQINCSLTTTPRTGMAVYQVPATAKDATVVIGSGVNATFSKQSYIKITDHGCEGYADGGQFCGYPVNYKVYFVAEFDVPFYLHGVWKGEQLIEKRDTVSGPASGAWFTFKTQKNKTVRYKFAISYVSIENARQNLQAENGDWNFEEVKTRAISKWNDYLGKIAVSGGTPDHTIQFYTHLYHSFLHPNLCNDVNGDYVGADNAVHRTVTGNYYTGFSNWDTYRTQVQLLAMLAPRETSDMMTSIVTFATQSGGSFPRWVLANTETGIMQGDPTAILVANAYAFGAQDFNTALALDVMRKGAEVPGARSQVIETRPFLKQYLEKGFINASMQLEYCAADFAIAQFIRQTTGDDSLYQVYLQRSQSWKNLFNPSTGWLQSRNDDGSWKRFDEDWREASYKNYFWMVPHNLAGLFDMIGGQRAAAQRLDSFFIALNASYNQEWFASGNEPDFQAPWLYNWAGSPAKTQRLVKRIIAEQYSNRPNGLPGNDDMGAMGAWYVLANIGLYPVIPGQAGFSINSPSFPGIDIRFPKGTLHIAGGSEQLPYIHSLRLNGAPYDHTWLPLASIENGGTLQYELSADSLEAWAVNDVAPSFDIAKKAKAMPEWAFGPFVRPANVNPVLSPDTNAVFHDPMTGKWLKWEANDVFNPAATIIDGNIAVLYRAEDRSGVGIGARTSRIGMATSNDGITMKRRDKPVLFPANDDQKEFEWTGGCEDPRVAVTEDGTYLMLYTQWNKKVPRLGAATSKDLVHWKKGGPVFRKTLQGKYFNMPTKSASALTKMKDGKQVLAKVNGKYFIYWGEDNVYAATSTDLFNWTPLEEADGTLKKLFSPRPGFFDSQLTECGPPALLTDKGIILFYNGKNLHGDNRDKRYTADTYCAGQALFDANDPTRLIDRLDEPFFIPVEPFEKSGQYPAGTVFIEGLVLHKGKWFLYYGCADSRVGVAIYDPTNK